LNEKNLAIVPDRYAKVVPVAENDGFILWGKPNEPSRTTSVPARRIYHVRS